MRVSLFAFFMALAFAVPARAQTSVDHLKCFKVKDAQAKAAYVADLGGLVAQAGCSIKVPASLACVASSAANVQPVPTGVAGTASPGTFACYKVKCPKGTVLPPISLSDEFGNRIMSPIGAKMVCAPATKTETCFQTFEPNLGEFVDLFESAFDETGSFEAPTGCGTSNEICCPGGTPTIPCGPIYAGLFSATVQDQIGQSRYDLSYSMTLATVADLPVTVPLVGQCGMHIDTTQGSISSITLSFPAYLNADKSKILSSGDAVLQGLETADVSITGGFGCQIANIGLGFFIDTLKTAFTEILLQQFNGGLCRSCDSTIVPCP